jgi:hypothetical protein
VGLVGGPCGLPPGVGSRGRPRRHVREKALSRRLLAGLSAKGPDESGGKAPAGKSAGTGKQIAAAIEAGSKEMKAGGETPPKGK